MKKLILVLLVGIFAIFTSVAQNDASYDAAVGYNETYWYFDDASNGLTAGDSTYTYTVRSFSLGEQKLGLFINADSVGGTANAVTVEMLSKTCLEADYIPRETLTWTSGADTTFYFESDSTHLSEYWQLKFTGADDTFIARFKELRFKFSKR